MAINFPDSPSNGDTHTAGGKTFTYDSTVGAWSPANATTFIELTDTPSSYGTASQIPAINSGANALEFIALPSSVTVYATVDLLPLSGNSAGDQALVTATNRLYIWNGSGWYNIALINTTPSISGVNSSYDLANDGTDTVITITATDPEGLPITYSIASDTSGNFATVTQGTGASSNVFTITPSTNNANSGTFSLTFRASDGVNIASAVASFTLQFSVENSNYTTALITSVGANLADNNDFVDSSTNTHTITAAGNAHQATFSPYRHGGYSTYFDGASDYISFADSTDWDLGSTWTVEAWVYPNADSSGKGFSTRGTTGTADMWEFFIFSSNYFKFEGYGGNNTSGAVSSTNTYASKKWYHVAYVYDSSAVKIYIDGVLDSTHNLSLSWNSAYGPWIGGNASYGEWFNGYITDLRVVKGTAVYTSAFAPPIERLTAIANTKLLTCHLPYIADGSTSNHSPTVNGNTKTEPFAPYDYSNPYSASDNGGSLVLDGTGDYISITDHADLDMGTSDFTIEGWYYPRTTAGGSNGLLSKRANSSEANGVLIYFSPNAAAGVPDLLVAQSGSWSINSRSSIGFKTGLWNHFAIVRNGTSFKLYINGKTGISVTSSITVTDNAHAFVIGAMGADGTNPIAACNIADFRVVKGTAVYTAEFTPPTAPLTAITNTSLLVQNTNASIIDKSQSGKTLTLLADTKSSTTQTKYLSSSIYFDGSGDHIHLQTSDGRLDWLINSSSVGTIEAWIYPTALRSGANVYQHPSILAIGNTYSTINVNASGQLTFYWYDGSLNSITSSATISVNTWHHIAVVVTATSGSNNLTLYVDGTSVGTGTYTGFGSQAATALTNVVYIGLGNASDANAYWPGYISDFRITKGLARYTANFTPPTEALKG